MGCCCSFFSGKNKDDSPPSEDTKSLNKNTESNLSIDETQSNNDEMQLEIVTLPPEVPKKSRRDSTHVTEELASNVSRLLQENTGFLNTSTKSIEDPNKAIIIADSGISSYSDPEINSETDLVVQSFGVDKSSKNVMQYRKRRKSSGLEFTDTDPTRKELIDIGTIGSDSRRSSSVTGSGQWQRNLSLSFTPSVNQLTETGDFDKYEMPIDSNIYDLKQQQKELENLEKMKSTQIIDNSDNSEAFQIMNTENSDLNLKLYDQSLKNEYAQVNDALALLKTPKKEPSDISDLSGTETTENVTNVQNIQNITTQND